jgi:hypothetical protein
MSPVDPPALTELLAAINTAHEAERAALQAAIVALRETHAGEALALRERTDVAEQRAERAEQSAAEERARADRLRDNLDSTHADLMTAERRAREAKELARKALDAAADLRQAEADRKAQGLLARLRAAWRG